MIKSRIKGLTLSLTLVLMFAMFSMQTFAITAQTPITRMQAEQRALSIINLKWTFNKSLNTHVSSAYSSAVSLASQFGSITSGTMTGIPYNWGGLDSIDSHSYNTGWTNFLDAVGKGAYVGNVNTDAGLGYIAGTAGLDCSGFVQSVFNIKGAKLSTTTLSNYFSTISINDIKHMDILVKPGDHVVIFDRWGTRNGVYGAYTYESTPDQTYGGIQGTKQYFISISEINSGYTAKRYMYLNDSTSTTAAISPGIFAQIVNVSSFANLRSSASTGSAIIATIPKGTIIYLNSYTNGWYQVNYNGKSGYIYGNLVGTIPSGKYVTISVVSYLNIRSSPSTTATIVGVLQKGNYATVLGYSSDGLWMKVQINGITGWASKRSLSYIY